MEVMILLSLDFVVNRCLLLKFWNFLCKVLIMSKFEMKSFWVFFWMGLFLMVRNLYKWGYC